MSRRCELTGVGVQFGNNVSHSQRKTRRRFEPNIKIVKCRSELTGQEYKLKVVARCLRSIEKAGGFDSYMLNAKVFKMSDNARSIRKEIKKNPNAIFISERSLFTDKLVFAKMLFDSGNIELVNYKIYLKEIVSIKKMRPLLTI